MMWSARPSTLLAARNFSNLVCDSRISLSYDSLNSTNTSFARDWATSRLVLPCSDETILWENLSSLSTSSSAKCRFREGVVPNDDWSVKSPLDYWGRVYKSDTGDHTANEAASRSILSSADELRSMPEGSSSRLLLDRIIKELQTDFNKMGTAWDGVEQTLETAVATKKSRDPLCSC